MPKRANRHERVLDRNALQILHAPKRCRIAVQHDVDHGEKRDNTDYRQTKGQALQIMISTGQS